MALNYALLLFSGLFIGVAASFTGLGGGFLMVPLLIALGYTAQKAVGTSFLAILIIAMSAVFAHSKFSNVDYKIAIVLGLGGVIGAQIGPHLLEHVSTASFKKIFSLILVGFAGYLFFQK
ncbi:MAG: sulfite exporter TauE/SafE family protein [Gammaproteobacteria bacterium]